MSVNVSNPRKSYQLLSATSVWCFVVLLGSFAPAASGDESARIRRLPAIPSTPHRPDRLEDTACATPPSVMSDRSTPIDFADYVVSADPTRASRGMFLVSKASFVSENDITFKLGGYVKGDFIHDFDAIASTDNFNTSTIFTDGREGENTRLHARQTRLNLDARWPTGVGDVRLFVEGDFFGEGSSFRLRHAYGTWGRWLAGQTWTTFTHIEALPSTLDFEAPIAYVLTRRGMIRWTYDVCDQLALAIAVEDPRETLPEGDEIRDISFDIEERRPSPDFVARVRYATDVMQLQFAGIVRQIAVQPEGGKIATETGYGFNWSGFVRLRDVHKLMTQIGFGEGVGGLRGINDGVPTPDGDVDLLDLFAVTAGYEVQWSERWTSTAAYSFGRLNNSPLQLADAIHSADYLAVNLVCNPAERVFVGMEYLHGRREDFGGASGEANRIQMSFRFDLP